MRRGNRTLNSADRNAGRDKNLINPILTKREHREGNGSLHPRAAVQTALRRGWKTAVLPTWFDADEV